MPWSITRCALGILLSALSLSACRSGAERTAVEAPEPPISGGTLRVIHERTESMDPLFIDDVYEGTISKQLFEGLIELDANLAPRPALAESWKVSDDGRHYEFQLRADVRFHDGSPFDASVAVRSLTTALRGDKPEPCLAQTYLADIEGASEFAEGRATTVRGLSAPDARTLLIDLKRPLSFFLAVLAMNQVGMSPSRESEGWEWRAAHPVGTGPFRFVRRETDGSVVLARNDDYWSVPALLDTLRFDAVTPLTQDRSVSILLRQRADGGSISTRYLRLMSTAAGFHVQSMPELSLTFLGLRATTPPFDRPEVRQALAHCVDIDGIVKEKQSRIVVAQGILPPGMPGFRPEKRRLGYDLEEAGRLLRLAGISPEHPHAPVTFYSTRGSTRPNWIRKQLAPDLASLGLPIELKELDWLDLDARVTKGTAPLFTMTWVADVPDPDAFLYFLFRSGEFNNLSGWSDPSVDSLLAVGRALPPGTPRYEVYAEVEDRVLAAMPCVPLYHETSAYAWEPEVEGIECSPFGISQTSFVHAWFNRAPKPLLAEVR